MFIAQLKSGRKINLLDGYSRSYLKNLQEQAGFYCPQCKSEVRVRAGTKLLWHFAHTPGKKECVASSESHYHLLGKKLLFEQALQSSEQAVLEPYFPRIGQRPDLWIPPHDIVEFQCSPLKPERFIERTNGYVQENLIPHWILGKKRLKPLSTSIFQVNAFDWLAARMSSSHFPFLTYFCPEEKQFYLLSRMISLSSTRVFGHLSTIPLTHFSFLKIVYSPPPLQRGLQFSSSTWLHKKKQWRLHAFKQKTSAHYLLKKAFLNQGSYLSLFPSEAGMPVPYSFTFSEATYVWQSFILLYCVLPCAIGHPIALREVCRTIELLIERRLLTPRLLPLLKKVTYRHACAAYLELLVACGILNRQGDQYMKQKNPTLPQTMNEAIVADYKLMEYSVKHGVNVLFSGKM
ncbi:Competence CoiA [Fictibacillus macauensis ZFHKF-1]|uniref:Competence CoiA n=1 Tax=Fictibacillus macauensis ZFHKF-1 TaxID=1196324 RepID=I8UCF5_9BACL|nr:competence protein CoiA family protein [Fictibacillus macauensis]EIT84600.1 Competence CoiA [Fictibacillus macauensis ZFHKF-1]